MLRHSSTATQQCALAAPYGPPNEAPRAPTASPTIFSTPLRCATTSLLERRLRYVHPESCLYRLRGFSEPPACSPN